MFAYCGNNPVSRADPSGHIWTIAVLIVVVVSTVFLSGCGNQETLPPSTNSTTVPPTTAPSASSAPTSSTHIPSQQEKSYAATVYAEAGGQNKRSKQAVAHIMNNRVGTRSGWNDIEAVISAPDQFEGYNNSMYKAAMDYYNSGIHNNPVEQAAMDECLAVVIPIYNGAEVDITGGALYFHSCATPDGWPYHDDYTQVYISGTEKFWFYK